MTMLLTTAMSLPECSEGLWYMASTYTIHPSGHDEAFVMACEAATWLMENQVSVFSPIVHGHSISVIGGLEECSHAYWMAVDEPFMDVCDGLIVLKTDNWESSYGIVHEIVYMKAQEKPIVYLDWPQ